MSKTEDPAIIACVPIVDEPCPIEGSRVKACAKCNQAVYLSCATYQAARDLPEGFLLYCLTCVGKLTEPINLQPLTEEQFAEAYRHLWGHRTSFSVRPKTSPPPEEPPRA